MCICIIKHWAHSDGKICMRGKCVDVCNVNVATPGALPDDCADRRNVYLEEPEKGECPMCRRREAFHRTVQAAGGLGESHWVESDILATKGDSRHPLTDDEDGPSIPIDARGIFTPSETNASSPSIVAWSCSTQSCPSICHFGEHEIEDSEHSGLRCRCCGVVAARRAAMREPIDSSPLIVAAPFAAVGSDAGAGSMDIDVHEQTSHPSMRQHLQHAETPDSELAYTPSGSNSSEALRSLFSSPLVSSPGFSTTSSVRERDLARNF